MNDIAMNECPWPDPHPPHLWADELTYPSGIAFGIKTWACSGKAEDDDD